MTRLHEAHFRALHVAQEARRDPGFIVNEGNGGAVIDTAAAVHDAWKGREVTAGVAPQMTLLELRALTFVLPFPPSVNDAWHHVPIRGSTRKLDRVHIALTETHRQFRSNVISIVHGVMRRAELRGQPLLGRLEMRVALYYGNRRRTDVDNRIKPLQDALTHAQAYADDSQIDRLVIERIIRAGAEECAVLLQEIAA